MHMIARTIPLAATTALAAALGAGCTVDSNDRLTLGTQPDHHADPTPADTGELSVTGGDGSSLVGDSASAHDRSAWPRVTVTVPHASVRHGAAIRPVWSLSDRHDNDYPTPETALEFGSISPWEQVAEFPLELVYAPARDAWRGIVSLIEIGPAGWDASPTWEGARLPVADEPLTKDVVR